MRVLIYSSLMMVWFIFVIWWFEWRVNSKPELPTGDVCGKLIHNKEKGPITINLPVSSVKGERFKFTVRSKPGQEVLVVDAEQYYNYKTLDGENAYLEKKPGDYVIAQQDGLSIVILMPEEDWILSGTFTGGR